MVDSNNNHSWTPKYLGKEDFRIVHPETAAWFILENVEYGLRKSGRWPQGLWYSIRGGWTRTPPPYPKTFEEAKRREREGLGGLGWARDAPVLPSGDSANRLLKGEPGALGMVLLHFAGRAALISVGLYAAGVRKPKQLAALSLAGSAAIEAFVLVYLAQKKE